MLTKFRLLRHVPDDRLPEEVKKLKEEYGHMLLTLWSAFKDDVGRSSLDRFDGVIADLDKWEKLRYGGFPDGKSTTMVFMVRRGPHDTWSDEPQDVYVFVLEDIDELFTEMVTASNINPTFLGERHRLKPAMREWYAKDNDHPLANVFRVDPPDGRPSGYGFIVVSKVWQSIRRWAGRLSRSVAHVLNKEAELTQDMQKAPRIAPRGLSGSGTGGSGTGLFCWLRVRFGR